jgi:hypothetical protein
MNYKHLIDLLETMDHISGVTEGGRNFKLTYNKANQNLHTYIYFGDDSVYESRLRMSDVLKNNFLSPINKMDERFFSKRIHAISGNIICSKTQRKVITVTGTQEKEPFSIRLKIENAWTNAVMNFRGNVGMTIDVKRSVPDHIPSNQSHNWLYLHYKKPEVWQDIIEFNIKSRFYTCCGVNISGRYNYCPICGKKQEVNNIKIDSILGTELLTLLS